MSIKTDSRDDPMPQARSVHFWGQAERALIAGLVLLAAALTLLGSLREATRDTAGPPGPLRVDPNTAPSGVLGALPGLGPVLVGRIIDTRRARPFESLDDLEDRVVGIGPATRAGIAPFVRAFESDGPTPPGR